MLRRISGTADWGESKLSRLRRNDGAILFLAAFAGYAATSNEKMISLTEKIASAGFCFLPASESRQLLGTLSDWSAFEASWDDMPLDTYMADGGRYRRRRHATLSVAEGARQATLAAHQPHYQSLDYNNLNGGISRHFEPIRADIVIGASMTALISLCITVFGRLAPDQTWHVEAHQFRIEAGSAAMGQPTPEGMHRDGVDYVMVLMVKRHNIAEGTTTIHDPSGRQLASFTLIEPLDMTLLDDARCLHGVTPVHAIEPSQRAYRDVLVVTFRARPRS